jgi:hypothetical protein
MSKDKTSITNENQQSSSISDSPLYLLMHEIYPDSTGPQKFDCTVLSSEIFERNKNEDFATLKNWVLKNGRKIFIIKDVKPFIKIIPDVTVVDNCK